MQDVQVHTWLNEIQNLDALFEAADSGLLIIDMDRRVRFINSQAQRLLGYEVGEAYGKRCNLVAKTSDCENNCPLTRTLDSGEEVRETEIYYTSKDNRTFKARASFVLLRDAGGTVVAGAEIFRDITEVLQKEEELFGRASFDRLIGKSYQMQEIYNMIEQVAPTQAAVLIQGESGTGKELIAAAIAARGKEKDKPFVQVNVSALPEGLLESELFGHTKGAFTGAYQEKKGKFEIADGGTIFLDEIGEMSPNLQVKLLRTLQNGEIQRVGESTSRRVRVRVIAATNKDLKMAIQRKEFREDLFYRLNVVPIFVPPLRDRKTDIPLLINHFLIKLNRSTKDKYIEKLSSPAIDILMKYAYPGNVRELENIIEYAYIRCNTNIIQPTHLPTELLEDDFSTDKLDNLDKIVRSASPLEEAEKEIIERVLEEENWIYQNAAKRLQLSRTTLWRKLKHYGIRQLPV